MTPEAQRIAIAEACGWGPYQLINGSYFTHDGEKPNCPDYVKNSGSLDKVIGALSEHQIELFCEWLNVICGADVEMGKPSFVAYFATAAQRCEAFLKTIGKWEEGQ